MRNSSCAASHGGTARRAACAIVDYSEQSGQPLTKHIIVEVTPAVNNHFYACAGHGRLLASEAAPLTAEVGC